MKRNGRKFDGSSSIVRRGQPWRLDSTEYGESTRGDRGRNFPHRGAISRVVDEQMFIGVVNAVGSGFY